jgi:hypothetical protein
MSLINKVKLALESAKSVAKNVAEGNDVTVSNEEKQRRLDTCKDCPSLKSLAGQMQCGECGCFLKAKAGLANVRCPRGLW